MNSPVTGGFNAQRASNAELWCLFFNLRLNKRLSKQSWGWWFESPSRPLWRHCYVVTQGKLFWGWNKNIPNELGMLPKINTVRHGLSLVTLDKNIAGTASGLLLRPCSMCVGNPPVVLKIRETFARHDAIMPHVLGGARDFEFLCHLLTHTWRLLVGSGDFFLRLITGKLG